MTDATIVGGLFVVIGFVLLVGVGWLLLLATRSAGWPSAAGRITASRRDEGAAGAARSPPSYRVRVTYEYDVAGRKYEGHRIAFGDTIWSWMGNRAKVDALVGQYHPGRAVDVHYDPRRPDRCTLATGTATLPFLPTLVAAGAIFLGGLGAMLGWIHVA